MTTIVLNYGISADYLTINGDNYYWGYDMSNNPGRMGRYGILPTVKEVIEKYPKPYFVIAGKNVFAGKQVSEEAVEEFKKKIFGGVE